MAAQWSVAVIGDINMDYITAISVQGLQLGRADITMTTPIRHALGGTAGNFAKAAVSYFSNVHVFGKLGNDPAAFMLKRYLQDLGVNVHVITDRTRHSRVVMVINTISGEGQSHRLMLADEDTANFQLAKEDLQEWTNILETVDALVVDAYSYLREPTKSACSYAMERSLSAGVTTVFDLVPHDSYKKIDLESLGDYLAPAKIVISETHTLCRFLSLPVQAGSTAADIAKILLPALRGLFGDKVWFLRFGEGNVNESLICIPDRKAIHAHTGYTEAEEKIGFGDQLTARELRWYLDTMAE